VRRSARSRRSHPPRRRTRTRRCSRATRPARSARATGEDGKPAEEEDLGKLLQKQMLEDAAKDSKDAAKPDGK